MPQVPAFHRCSGNPMGLPIGGGRSPSQFGLDCTVNSKQQCFSERAIQGSKGTPAQRAQGKHAQSTPAHGGLATGTRAPPHPQGSGSRLGTRSPSIPVTRVVALGPVPCLDHTLLQFPPWFSILVCTKDTHR